MQQPIPKSYLPLAKKTVIEQTLTRLLAVPEIKKIILVLAADDIFWPKLSLAQHPKIETVIGGKERCYSVLKGLAALAQYADSQDWVLVHDVARPCVALSDVQKLLHACWDHPVGGLLARPIVETVKRADQQGCAAETLERKQLWAALTPQCFRFGLLSHALEQAIDRGCLVTDESHAVELFGFHPLLVEGSSENIKITYPEDLKLAENILMRGEQ